MSYNCPTCGAFVSDGASHVCAPGTFIPIASGAYPVAQPQTLTFTDWSGLYLRIALALERIAAALEKTAANEV